MKQFNNKIYFMRRKKYGLIKISRSPKGNIIKTIEGGACLENILHKYFRHNKRRGDWFNPNHNLNFFLNNYNSISTMTILSDIGYKLSLVELKYLKKLVKTRDRL